jgi:hypothetical protein
MRRLLLLVLAAALYALPAAAGPFTFDGAGEYGTGEYGYYYVLTGGKFPTGTDPNGDNGSGGTMRFITDDPAWGRPTDVWHKDDWFPQNAGIALTMKNGAATVYDNNGIADGTQGDFYDAQAQGTPDASTPGLYRAYSMSNNWDWIYASYFKLAEETTFDTLLAYFDWNGSIFGPGDVPFDPFSPNVRYRMNIWSTTGGNCQADGVGCLPTNTNAFVGDVFSTDATGGSFAVTQMALNRVFANGSTDPIGQLQWTGGPVTLPAGEYFFSHDAYVVPEPASLLLIGTGVALGARRLRRRASK